MNGRDPLRILLLGGTGEAARLSGDLIARFGMEIDLTTSLAGRTEHPSGIAGKLRIGGFGGVAGLTHYLRNSQTALVIDATHPFAARISQSAALACAATGVMRLRLERPVWHAQPGDHWIEVADTMEAAETIRLLAKRVWLTIGTSDLAAFASLRDVWFLIRSIALPETPPPLAYHQYILGRGPFRVEAEKALISDYRIDALVTKASGGRATGAKLIAAREASIPVVMIRRPEKPAGTHIGSIDDIVFWVSEFLRGGD